MAKRLNRPRMPTGLRLILGLIGLIAAGTLFLLLPGVAVKGTLSFQEALFTAVSALTVTGLSTISPAQDLTRIGQILLLGLIQIGGAGFIVGVVLILQLLGRRISYLNRLTLKDGLGLDKPGAALSLAWFMIRLTLALEAAGAFLLWLVWREPLGDGKAAFFALFHAVSAFCNAGFELFSGLPQYPNGIPQDTLTLIILGILIFVGGLGLPLLVELGTWDRKHRLSMHTRVTLVTVMFLLLGGGIGLFLIESRPDGLLAGIPTMRGLLLAFFQSISARTAGFNGLGPFSALEPSSQLLMMILMFIGCAPVSMGGGITTGTFAVLVLGVYGFVRGQTQIQIGGRMIAEFSVRRASIILTVSLSVIFLASFAILTTHQATLDDVLFEVVSAFATCGLSLDFTNELNAWGQTVLMLVMFWGRLGPLSIMVALRQMARPSRIGYPEEQILLG